MRALLATLLLVVSCVAGCAAAGSSATPGADAPSWRTASLTDVVTGETFRIAELRGSVVAIETMAIWCSTCRIQQSEAQAALARFATGEVVYISLDVDPRERAADLAAYAAREGFGWRFVVAAPEVARSLVDEFGEQVLSPPATPMIVLDRAGAVAEQHVGIRNANQLVTLFEQLLG